MRHQDFYAQCHAHNWGWRNNEDPDIQSASSNREHELRKIAEESEALRRILVRAEANYWQLRAKRQGVPR